MSMAAGRIDAMMPLKAEDERLAVQALARRQLGLLPPPLPFPVHYANVFSSHPAHLYGAYIPTFQAPRFISIDDEIGA